MFELGVSADILGTTYLNSLSLASTSYDPFSTSCTFTAAAASLVGISKVIVKSWMAVTRFYSALNSTSKASSPSLNQQVIVKGTSFPGTPEA